MFWDIRSSNGQGSSIRVAGLLSQSHIPFLSMVNYGTVDGAYQLRPMRVMLLSLPWCTWKVFLSLTGTYIYIYMISVIEYLLYNYLTYNIIIWLCFCTFVSAEFPCLDDPCQNGATCNPIGVGRYRCICPLFFIGRDCETGNTVYEHLPICMVDGA